MNNYCPYFLCPYFRGYSDFRKYPETYKTMVRNTIMDFIGQTVQTTIESKNTIGGVTQKVSIPIIAQILSYDPRSNMVSLIKLNPDGSQEYMMVYASEIDIDKTTLYNSYLYPSPYSSQPPGGVGSVPPSGGEGFSSGL